MCGECEGNGKIDNPDIQHLAGDETRIGCPSCHGTCEHIECGHCSASGEGNETKFCKTCDLYYCTDMTNGCYSAHLEEGHRQD